MKFFSESRRSVPTVRKKYGKPECKKDALQRLQKERNVREKKTEMKRDIEKRNKDEFHFLFYSHNKNMVRKTAVSVEELKKTLRYVNSEISRCRGVLERAIKPSAGTHTVFSDGSIVEVKTPEKKPQSSEYEEYISNLIEKRKEVVEMLSKK